jgi:hypothetical protein
LLVYLAINCKNNFHTLLLKVKSLRPNLQSTN